MSGYDQAPKIHEVGTLRGPRAAQVKRDRSGEAFQRYVVWRYRPDGSLDFVTRHWTHRGAAHAARVYEQTGRILGVQA